MLLIAPDASTNMLACGRSCSETRLGPSTSVLTQSEIETYLNSSLRHGSFAAFWLHNNKEDLLVAATPTSSKFYSHMVTLWGNYEDLSAPGSILFHYGESWNLLRADQRLIFAKSWPWLPGINRDTGIYLFCEVIFRHRYLFGAKCVG